MILPAMIEVTPLTKQGTVFDDACVIIPASKIDYIAVRYGKGPIEGSGLRVVGSTLLINGQLVNVTEMPDVVANMIAQASVKAYQVSKEVENGKDIFERQTPPEPTIIQ